MLESFFKRILYIRISPQRLIIRDPHTGQEFSENPEVAIAGEPAKIVAIGSKARPAVSGTGGKVVNPFAHPRSLVSDFTVAQQLLKIAARQDFGKPIFRPLPTIVMHPLGDPEGGFTQIERRALHELALGAGASKVVVWVGRELSDAELVSRAFESAPV
jgi:rod shape-determining protein MreB